MLKVLESILLSTEYLEKKEIESARLNAELLLADILGCKRLDLYMSYDRPLMENEVARYREYISRRGKFEPLQYILGHVEFYGNKFIVNESVLIPRPETELLVEKVIEIIKENSLKSVLDIGTGSGNIIISIAKEIENIETSAIDVSEDALEVALLNTKAHDLEQRINFYRLDILNDSDIEKLIKFDVVVSNPPYVDENQLNSLQKEIIDYEPIEAVTDYSDGLKFYKKIISISNELITENGYLFFELGEGQSGEVENLMTEAGFSNITIIKDYAEIDRIIYGVKN